MAFEKIENADLIGKMIAELADVPELTADELKKRFDAASKDVIIPKFNKLIDALAAVSAASNIGMNPPEGITAEQNIAAVITALAVSVKSNSDSRHTHSNKAVIDAITADAKKKYDDLVSLFSAIKTISNVVKDDSTLLPTGKAIVDYVEELGGGDMLKATYDSDNDGVVDNASKLGGQSPTYYQKASDDTLNTQNKTVVGAVNEVQEMMEALTEKLTVVEVDMTSAKLNTDVLASYPAGFYRKNCVIIGISVYDRVNNNYYSLFGDTTVTAMLGSKVIVKTSQSNYIGAGSKIRVVLYKIA